MEWPEQSKTIMEALRECDKSGRLPEDLLPRPGMTYNEVVAELLRIDPLLGKLYNDVKQIVTPFLGNLDYGNLRAENEACLPTFTLHYRHEARWLFVYEPGGTSSSTIGLELDVESGMYTCNLVPLEASVEVRLETYDMDEALSSLRPAIEKIPVRRHSVHKGWIEAYAWGGKEWVAGRTAFSSPEELIAIYDSFYFLSDREKVYLKTYIREILPTHQPP